MKTKIIFGSSTGNTKDMLDFVATIWLPQMGSLRVLDSANIKSSYSFQLDILYILAFSSWGIAPVVPQEDFANFWELVNKSSIKSNRFGIIGLGDRYYPNFCGAIDLIESDILSYSGRVVCSSLALGDPWHHQKHEITEWLKQLKRQF